MQDLKLRPRFRITTHVEPNDVLRILLDVLDDEHSPIDGRVFESSAVLKVRPEEVHFWSPQLQLSIDPKLDGGSVVHGLFGPHPTIWGLFVALYVAIGFLTVMGVIFGYSQSTIGQPPSAYWAAPAGIAAALMVYAVGRTGRRLGMNQMRELKRFVEERLVVGSR